MTRQNLPRPCSGRLTVRILHIDDDLDYLALTKHHLNREGHAVTSESNPRDALPLLKGNGFAVVLCDYWMPELTGPQVLTLARVWGETTPFIFLTDQDINVVRREVCDSSISTHFVSKGCSPSFFSHLSALVQGITKTNPSQLSAWLCY